MLKHKTEGGKLMSVDGRPFNPRDYKLTAKDLNEELASEKLGELLQRLINIQKYSEDKREILTFQEWSARREDMWASALVCKSILVPYFFVGWIEQGVASFQSFIEGLDPNNIIDEFEDLPQRETDSRTKKEKLRDFWYDHAASRWIGSIFYAYKKGTFSSYFAPGLSDLIKDNAVKPYLELARKVGLDSNEMLDFYTGRLLERRAQDNDDFIYEVTKLDLKGELPLFTNGNGHHAPESKIDLEKSDTISDNLEVSTIP